MTLCYYFLLAVFLLLAVGLFDFSEAFFFTVLVVFVDPLFSVFELPFLVTILWLVILNYLRSTSKYKSIVISKMLTADFT